MFDIKPIWIIAVALVFGASACGPQATATIDPGQIQVSAAAMVSTMVAATNATLHARRSIAPTASPIFDATISPLPVRAVLSLPATAVPSNTSDMCSGNISVNKGDTLARFLVNNKINQQIIVSFQLKKDSSGDCGYWSMQARANSSTLVTNLPLGCYNIFAFNQNGKPDFQNVYFGLCTGNNVQKFTINVTVNRIEVITS